jgi:hypothetical protein
MHFGKGSNDMVFRVVETFLASLSFKPHTPTDSSIGWHSILTEGVGRPTSRSTRMPTPATYNLILPLVLPQIVKPVSGELKRCITITLYLIDVKFLSVWLVEV